MLDSLTGRKALFVSYASLVAEPETQTARLREGFSEFCELRVPAVRRSECEGTRPQGAQRFANRAVRFVSELAA